jgi:peptidoglycan-N-acetylglucosamine deacetylase
VSPRALTRFSLLCIVFAVLGASSQAVAGSAPADPSLAGSRVAITIDDIPENGDMLPGTSRAEIAAGLIKVLKDNHLHQVYGFTNGYFMDWDPAEFEIYKTWLRAGVPLGNHTYNHPNLNDVGATAFIADIEKQEQLLAKLKDFSPLLKQRFMFRYPFLDEGDTLEKRDEVRAYLAKHGYQIAEVTTDYSDWAWTDAYVRCSKAKDQKTVSWLKKNIVESADQHLRASNVISDRLFHRRVAQILLMHDGEFDVITLGAILKHWRAEGVSFISLKEALRDPVYSINPNFAYKGGSAFLEQIANSRNIAVGDLEPQTLTVDQLNQLCKAPTAPAH